MKKRIRKKIEKRRAAEREANGGTPLNPLQQLRAALDDLRHSAMYFLDTALGEVQHGALSVVQELRERASKLLGALGQPMEARAARTVSDSARSALS
jgi:hypothetical protein